ncbi:fungal-specific transcription factor domain-containing protein [Dactylonectria macrodidyma]|uniref:Fungal-specific transcription factor domain-containing protein n=1 Tax=Dactylonectria macrodidyma TaxID=307937 RepID=A0A9P9J735_9HYPO|nr:fungal-specific transcription factor domain-containing protein [Dactylonectria macrodidyma]
MARDSTPPSKRRRNRVPVSCFSCRTLKTKCDGARPVCSTCAHSGRDCVFVQQGISGGAANMVMVDQDYLRGLESRLELLEKAAPTSSPAKTRDQGASTLGQAASSTGAIRLEPTASSIVVDANLSIGGLSFTQLLLNTLYGYGNVEAQSMVTDSESRARPLHLTGDDLYAIPDNAADILDRYFTIRHTLTPLFHGPSARSVFNEALRCPAEDRHRQALTFALINMIFALCTSHWVVDVEANPRTARRHYEMAMALLQPTLLRDWRLEHVQALLLGARYLQTTSCGDECWNVLGLAIRIAYGLRLHKDPPESDPPPLRETKRRVWYAAYTLDMHWSMIYQRPSATRSADFSVSLPEDLDDDCIREDGVLYPMPKRPSCMSFSIEMIKLYRIVEKVSARMSEDMEITQGTAEWVMALDGEYQKWRRDLPAHLVLDYNNPKEPHWILALRANMVRILIHRPSLGEALHRSQKAPWGQDSMASQILQLSQKICLDAAMESVDIVALRYEQTKQTMGLNWFNIYYLFNAVIVLVSQVIYTPCFQESPALVKVEKALNMVKDMSSNHSFAKRAFAFLQGLLQCMHQSIGSLHSRGDCAILPDSLLPSPTTAAMPMASSVGPETFPGLHALFGYAKDVADDLQAQLESFDPGNFAESSWTLDDLIPGR